MEGESEGPLTCYLSIMGPKALEVFIIKQVCVCLYMYKQTNTSHNIYKNKNYQMIFSELNIILLNNIKCKYMQNKKFKCAENLYLTLGI